MNPAKQKLWWKLKSLRNNVCSIWRYLHAIEVLDLRSWYIDILGLGLDCYCKFPVLVLETTRFSINDPTSFLALHLLSVLRAVRARYIIAFKHRSYEMLFK